MATFKNPNEPKQPQAGVYGWYAIHETKPEVCIYIGMAGKQRTLIPKGTLFRGVSELQRNTFTSDSPNYRSLDTDFIVGTAIQFFETNGYCCEWRHLEDMPEKEFDFIGTERPILQNAKGQIEREFRLFRDKIGYWKDNKTPEGIQEAKTGVFKQLELAISKHVVP